MIRKYYMKKICLLNFIFIIVTVATLMRKDSSDNSHSSHSFSIKLPTSYPTSSLSQQKRINDLLASYANRYETSSGLCNTTYSLTDQQRKLFDSITSKLYTLRTQMMPYPHEYFHGRGIVLTAGKTQLKFVRVNLKMLEQTGTRLPIQIWYSSSQVPTEHMAKILDVAPKLDVSICCFLAAECRSLTHVRKLNSIYVYKPDITDYRLKAFPYKPAAIISSTFAEVLFLDCDSYATRDPEELFSSDPMYLRFGALFYPDGLRSRQHPAVWDVFNTTCIQDEYEFDSAAILVNKQKAWDGLYMTKLINDHYQTFYHDYITDGDKDTFRLAFRFMKVKYYLVMIPCATGSFNGSHFCGHTLCKTDSLAKHIYINHVHMFKYDNIKYSPITLGYTRVGIGDPNNNTFYFQFCTLPNSTPNCFHILEKPNDQMNENNCYTGNVTLAELTDHEYTLKESLLSETTANNRVLMSRTNHFMPHFVDNLIKYSE